MPNCVCDFHKITIEVIKVEGACPFGFKVGAKYNLQDVLPSGLCLYAFQSFYPYIFTLSNGGHVPWVRKNDGVIVQCPAPQGIFAKIFKPEKATDGVRVVIEGVKSECPFGHKKDNGFSVSCAEQKFCLKALYSLYPFIVSATADNSDTGSFHFSCPSSAKGNVVFSISHH